jgi:hypothetical protein
MGVDEAHAKIKEVPGVGEYSAGIVMGRSSAPIDAWSVIIMSELLHGKTPQKPRQDIDKINAAVQKRWGKWSWMAFVYIMNDLENLSRIYPLSRLTWCKSEKEALCDNSLFQGKVSGNTNS